MTPVRILVVEDSRTQAERLRYVLEERGYEVKLARNGREALESLEDSLPGLVLSDIMMPEMDGYQLCQTVKHDPRLAGIPVILLTTLADPRDVIRGLESGADGFIVKPYEESYLLSRIHALLANPPGVPPPAAAETSEFVLDGETYRIRAGANQILTLLLSTYQAAVQRNLELLRARDEARELNSRLARLQRVTAALSEALTPDQVLEIMLQETVAAFGAQNGLVALLDEADSKLCLARALNYTPQVRSLWGEIALDAPLPLTAAARSGAPVWNFPLADMWRNLPSILPEQRSGDTSFTALPMVFKGRCIGVIGLGFAQDRAFLPNDRMLAVALAQQCTQALERARLYESERHTREIVQEAVNHRDQFIAIASHELKTPLTAIKGYSELLLQRAQEAGLNEQQLRMLHSILQQSGRLEKMISLLLDISRLEKGQLTLVRAPVDLGRLVQSVIEEMEPTLRHHTLLLTCEDCDIWVQGDELRMEQVLQNLIQNAVKYSPMGGSVKVSLAQERDTAHFMVEDHGIGIPPDELPRLFTRFYRARNAEAYHISGFGLGLYVVREIVRMHGGDIQVESEEGKGTTFTVHLPVMARPPAGEVHTAVPADHEE